MAQPVLGLDIGHSSIKAVLLTPRGLIGGRLLAFENVDVGSCGSMEEALKKLFENKNFSGVSCGVTLPLDDILLRQIVLPFRDENKIRKTLAFELEPLIPVPIEEVAVDYLSLPRGGLLVGALTKKSIREWIEKIEAVAGDVSMIDVSPTALAAQMIHGRKFAARGILLDVGRTFTTLTFYEDEAVIQVRSFAFGGEDITQALARELCLERDQAEEWKVAGNDPQSCPGAIDACRFFCQELKNTIEYMRLNGILQNDPSQIILTGGGSLFTPLRKEIENYFSTPVERLDLAGLKQLEMDEAMQSGLRPEIMNTAVAAAMRLSAGRKSFNFRQGEFEARNVRLNIRSQARRAAIVAGIILAMAVGNQILDYSLKTRQLNAAKKQIAQIFKRSFPDAQAAGDPLEQMKAKIAEDKKAFGFEAGLPSAPAVELLKEISGMVSPSLDIVMTALNYENKVIMITGQAKKVDDVTLLQNELMKSKYFNNVTMGSTSLSKDGSKVDFNLKIEVK